MIMLTCFVILRKQNSTIKEGNIVDIPRTVQRSKINCYDDLQQCILNHCIQDLLYAWNNVSNKYCMPEILYPRNIVSKTLFPGNVIAQKYCMPELIYPRSAVCLKCCFLEYRMPTLESCYYQGCAISCTKV